MVQTSTLPTLNSSRATTIPFRAVDSKSFTPTLKTRLSKFIKIPYRHNHNHKDYHNVLSPKLIHAKSISKWSRNHVFNLNEYDMLFKARPVGSSSKKKKKEKRLARQMTIEGTDDSEVTTVTTNVPIQTQTDPMFRTKKRFPIRIIIFIKKKNNN